jgi:hypothetical protein
MVESAHAKDIANGGGGHVERACASYLHECNAALAEEPCSQRSVSAMEAAAGALPHCGGETFGSYTGGNWATSYKGYQDEFQHRCVGLCDPKCIHGTCTGLKQCTCYEGWHGPTCEFVVCPEPGCGVGYCDNDGTCVCPASHTGDHCEQEITTTTTTTTTTTGISKAACADHAAAVIENANSPQGICTPQGEAAYQIFEDDLPYCKKYYIEGAERTVGYLTIERQYEEIYESVQPLHTECRVKRFFREESSVPDELKQNIAF